MKDAHNRFMPPELDDARRAVNALATLCMLAILCTPSQSLICASSSDLALSQDGASLKPGIYWKLSSKWRWNASGVRGETGWRVEREDWNDTITIEEVSRSEFLLRLKRVGAGSLEAFGGFVIGGRPTDSWKIDREYSLKVNATTFRDPNGKPVRWIINVKGVDASGSVPQMWVDKDYSYREVQFRVVRSERLKVGSISLVTWAVSYTNLTTGYWSKAGNHSIGTKEETLNYDKKIGLLLQGAYVGVYSLKMHEGGWNETETFFARVVGTNVDLSADIQSMNPIGFIIFGVVFAAAGVTLFVTIAYWRRKIRLS